MRDSCDAGLTVDDDLSKSQLAGLRQADISIAQPQGTVAICSHPRHPDVRVLHDERGIGMQENLNRINERIQQLEQESQHS